MGGLVSTLSGATGLNSFYSQVIVLVTVILFTVLILMFTKNIFTGILNSKRDDPWLLKGSKNGNFLEFSRRGVLVGVCNSELCLNFITSTKE